MTPFSAWIIGPYGIASAMLVLAMLGAVCWCLRGREAR